LVSLLTSVRTLWHTPPAASASSPSRSRGRTLTSQSKDGSLFHPKAGTRWFLQAGSDEGRPPHHLLSRCRGRTRIPSRRLLSVGLTSWTIGARPVPALPYRFGDPPGASGNGVTFTGRRPLAHRGPIERFEHGGAFRCWCHVATPNPYKLAPRRSRFRIAL
jgi:hypothetical protein